MLDDHTGLGDHPIDEAIDEAEKESFPASDPQSSWAGPDPAALDSESMVAAPGGPSTHSDGQGSSGPAVTPKA
jgi:hypothetical protein